jgi:hypothetical protein
MTERPILFSGPMVRAVLDGTKTQTRRAVKPSARQTQWLSGATFTASPRLTIALSKGRLGAACQHPLGGPLTWIACPFGSPGDRLWLRETWWHGPQPDRAEYDADFDDDATLSALAYGAKRKPSIHMPRWASRITLEITDVRVEQLRDISEEDARAEGVSPCARCDGRGIDPVRVVHDPEWCAECGGGSQGMTARDEFAWLWDSLNPTASWEMNPWVWVLEFKRVEVKR